MNIQPPVPPVVPAAQPVPPVVVAPAAPAPVFVRAPGEYVDPNNQFIDFSLERERKIYKSATTGLEQKFDLSPTKLQSFLNRVQERVAEYNWNDIIEVTFPIPPGAVVPPPNLNLITNYGQITKDQVKAHAEVYMMMQDRRNQRSGMLYHFLNQSLTEEAHNILDINVANYTINGQKEGVCFLKEIITQAYVDTNATVDNIRKSIAKLDDKIKELKFDVKTFNAYVQTQVNALAAHGITCTELLTNLFTAYNQVQDSEFIQHVNMYYFQYTNDELVGQNRDITKTLMRAMEQHYHRRMADGTWNPKHVKTDK
jgi:hypothetical protein